jgi:hypothetical protein
MDKLIIKFFGVNRMNFWGWLCAGLLIIGCCLFLVLLAFHEYFNGDVLSAIHWLLVCIAALLLGLFGVALQAYGSLLTEKLERQQAALHLPAPEDLQPSLLDRQGMHLPGAEQRGIR